ncbi:MAG: peptidase S41 [Flavobacteriales bacterium CG_4_9_14_3_um_filter_40_17]|nr:MAG: peptidase S41 [Flavobacteriales bacterium CG_4_9_14_3_um_filter_40_17]
MRKKITLRLLLLLLIPLLLISAATYKSEFFEIAKQIEIFTTLYKEVNMNYVDEVNPAALMDKAIKEMLDDLDPYTVFMNEQDVEDAKIRSSGEYSGIGALIKIKKDRLLVVEPFKDYPADQAGLKAGDEIIKIGDVNVADVKDDASTLLKGAQGSKISLTFLRNGNTMNTELNRKDIEVDAVPFYKLIGGKTGYIVLNEFSRKATSQVTDAIRDMKIDGLQNIILDLRGNPGGLLNEAVDIVNLFTLKGQLVVSTKSKVEKFNNIYLTRKNPLDTEIPLVILINGRSASASEIVSGSLQDLDRAVVLGSRSFGKGLVQRPKPLLYGTQVKITISRYYIPSGRGIQALDYQNRDENGNAQRIDKKNVQAFKTKNGRTVFDHGGIMPDVQIENQQLSPITNALLAEDLIFDFASQYFYNHATIQPSDFRLTDKDFEEFKTFVKKQKFNYQTLTEKSLTLTIEAAGKDSFNTGLQNDLNQIKGKIEVEKQAMLEASKPEVLAQLTDEIVKRYAYRKGLYEYYLTHDASILKAQEILGNPKQYNSILGIK